MNTETPTPRFEAPIHCEEEMVYTIIGAPGTGAGWVCLLCGHYLTVIPTRILTEADVR